MAPRALTYYSRDMATRVQQGWKSLNRGFEMMTFGPSPRLRCLQRDLESRDLLVESWQDLTSEIQKAGHQAARTNQGSSRRQ